MAQANDQGDGGTTRILQVATSEPIAIMFADVCGGTRMYESAGHFVASGIVHFERVICGGEA
jgi:hypothetical protein